MMALLVIATPAFAVKPEGVGAKFYSWNLSADVMPVPPYGSGDIPGSDTASNLIVNQPNGNTQVTITGPMKGLNPNTEYTVYLSNAYVPYVFTGWDISGTWVIDVEYLGTDYAEELVLFLSGDNYTGTLELVGGGSEFDVVTGSVTGNTLELNLESTFSSLKVQLTGTIASNGSMGGNWADTFGGTRTGTWESTSGAATDHTGDIEWSGLFTSAIQPFTFTTDDFGEGSWHVNLKDEHFADPGTYSLSVWINRSGTILISDVFRVEVD